MDWGEKVCPEKGWENKTVNLLGAWWIGLEIVVVRDGANCVAIAINTFRLVGKLTDPGPKLGTGAFGSRGKDDAIAP